MGLFDWLFPKRMRVNQAGYSELPMADDLIAKANSSLFCAILIGSSNRRKLRRYDLTNGNKHHRVISIHLGVSVIRELSGMSCICSCITMIL